jgi:putative Mg2+ transporter-C (MgtC) family protein
VGFYGAAILLAGLSAATMMWGSRLENWLPSHHAVALKLVFKADHAPDQGAIGRFIASQGYELARGSIAISSDAGRPEWRFVMVVVDRATAVPLDRFAHELRALEGVDGFALAHARN